jgi:hypothetical protein
MPVLFYPGAAKINEPCPRELSAAFHAQPAACAAAYEAALRAAAIAASSAEAAAAAAPAAAGTEAAAATAAAVDEARGSQLSKAFKYVGGVVEAAFTADPSALNSTLQACWQQQQQQESLQGPLLRLLSLHATCFKCCLRSFASAAQERAKFHWILEVGWACLSVVQGFSSCVPSSSSSSSSTAVRLTNDTASVPVAEPAAAAAAAAPAISPAVVSAWLAQLARCVAAAIEVLGKQLVGRTTADANVFTSAVALCEKALQAFQQQLPHADVAADALQELLQELAPLMPFAVDALTVQEAAAEDDKELEIIARKSQATRN